MPNYEHSGLETKVKGHKRIGHEEDEKTYDSRGEGRQAMLLIRNNVRFTPHQEYDVIDRNGNHRTYEVDFDLHRPHKFKGISYPVSALEYKGVFNERAKERMDWWEFKTDRNMYIVAGNQIQKYWRDNGMKDSHYKNGGR